MSLFSSFQLQENKEGDGEDDEDEESSSIHLPSFQNPLDGKRLEERRRRERKRKKERAVLGMDERMNSKEFISI